MHETKKIKAILQIICILAILFNVFAYVNPEPTQVDILNQLVQVNIDRAAGYETASKEVNEPYLKRLFLQFANTSRVCKAELDGEIVKLSGKPVEGTKTTFKIYQVWMNTKSIIMNHEIETILHSCHYGETIAEDIYTKVISKKGQSLDRHQFAMACVQLKLLKADHERVRGLQNLLSINH